MISNTDSMPLIYSTAHILVKVYLDPEVRKRFSRRRPGVTGRVWCILHAQWRARHSEMACWTFKGSTRTKQEPTLLPVQHRRWLLLRLSKTMNKHFRVSGSTFRKLEELGVRASAVLRRAGLPQGAITPEAPKK